MHIRLDRRYRGPLRSANGGYAAGRLAQFVDADVVEVTLRLPPPLERPLEVRVMDGSALLLDDDAVVAEARAAALDDDVPEPVSLALAGRARRRHVGTGNPLFRECFVCGVRDEQDGLGVRVGPAPGREPVHAGPWSVRASRPELVWAAIDCPGAYAVGAEGRGDVVLGRMTARLLRLPDGGGDCVVVSWPLGEDGRKLFAGTALYSASGELLAHARQVWIAPR